MTYKEWEKKLFKYLKPLSKEERTAAVEYYREMYGDKLEAGETQENILLEFGPPASCAERILGESGKTLPKRESANISLAWIVGIFFLSVLVIIPLFIVALSLVAVFAAMAVGGAAVALAGAVYVVYSPFAAIEGIAFPAVVANMGMGFAAAGVGLLLFVAFIPLTKHSCKWLIKALVFVYTRRTKE